MTSPMTSGGSTMQDNHDIMTQSTTSSVMDMGANAGSNSNVNPSRSNSLEAASNSTPSNSARKFFSGSYGVRLVRFFIFNSSMQTREGEENKKIVFFRDNTTDDPSLHARYVGLIEAAVSFTKNFINEKKNSKGNTVSRTLHTLKTKSVTIEPEPGFVMVITVTVPKTKRKKKGPTGSATSGNTYECTYSPDAVHDNVLESVLRRSHHMFKLFTGGFVQMRAETGTSGQDTVTLDEIEEDIFRTRVSAFFSKYVTHSLGRSLEKADLGSNLFQGVRVHALETQAFLKVHSFVRRIGDAFKDSVQESLFFHQGNVVWSGLQQHETCLLYQYLNETLLPQHLDSTTTGENVSQANSPFAGHQGKFLGSVDKLPKLFIGESSKPTYQLLVYHALASTVCLLVPCDVTVTPDLRQRLDGHIGTALTNMSADLLDVFGRGPSNNSDQLLLVPAPTQQEVAASALPSSGNSSSKRGGMSQSASTSSLKDNLTVTPSSQMDQVGFIYYNGTNRALKNTFLLGPTTGGEISSVDRDGLNCFPSWTAVTPTSTASPYLPTNVNTPETANFQEATHVIAEMNKEFERLNKFSASTMNDDRVKREEKCNSLISSTSQGSDLCLRLASDQWVVGRRVEERQVYFVVAMKNAQLPEVMELVNKVVASEFRNISLLEK